MAAKGVGMAAASGARALLVSLEHAFYRAAVSEGAARAVYRGGNRL